MLRERPSREELVRLLRALREAGYRGEELMEEASKRLQPYASGVEGLYVGAFEVDYVNLGDAYAETIVRVADSWGARYFVASWGSIVEELEGGEE